MKALTVEWVEKAEGGFNSALRETHARKLPNYDAACFHAQQCVEKYLKACLQEASITFTKTHNLVALVDLILPLHGSLALLRPRLMTLNLYGVEVRYPGLRANKLKAREAVAICRGARGALRGILGLR